MSIEYTAQIKNDRLGVVVDAIGASGFCKILDASGNVLATLALAETAGSVSSGVLTITAPISGTVTTSGTAAAAELTTASGAVKVSGLTVGTAGTNIIVDDVALVAGGTFYINSFTIAHA